MLDRTDERSGEAVLTYRDGDFLVVRPGRFVRCAVTGEAISLEDLRYWNVDLQEAYKSATEAAKRWRELNSDDKGA